MRRIRLIRGRLQIWAGERGAVTPLVAILLPAFVLCASLALDFGMLVTAKAQLQRAVDAAALSAAAALQEPGANPTTIARQVLAANGIRQADLVSPLSVTFPLDNQVRISATQNRPSYLLRAASPIRQFRITASATADINTYAEVPIKPTGQFGKIQQTNPAVFGPNALHSNGDDYSPLRLNDGTTNPDYARLPYGYLFRIDVPPSYPASQLAVELFDPDSYNAPTPADASHTKENTYVDLNAFGTGWHQFYRVDELRPANGSSGACNLSGSSPLCSSWATTTRYTLWHFDPHITNPFVDPATIGTQIASVQYGYDPTTDLKWVLPSGFTINLASYDQERDGGWYFYLYVQSTAGSSENNFDIRTGRPGQTEEDDVNEQQGFTWNSGGSAVYAKRAYPMNNAELGTFRVYVTQVPANAAGQILQVRHFDNDCSSGCTFPYYLRNTSGTDIAIGTGRLSGNDTWGTVDNIAIPDKGTALYNQVFPSGAASAWLVADYPPTIAQDTSVWELMYLRPRLIQ
jgi:Flp pilus assembly protein TadG